jgi:hypothetical protein
MIPNDQSFYLLFEEKLNVMIFFNDEKENPILEVLKLISKQYKEYFLIMIVDYTDDNLDFDKAEYLKNFMGVTHSPALRILKIEKHIHRYKFIGSFEENAIDYFI